MIGLYKFLRLLLKTFWQLLDPNFNGLKDAPMQTKYIVSFWLACFWALAFSLYAGELYYLGYNVFGHGAVISMAFITWLVIKTIQKQYPERSKYDQLRQPDRRERDSEMSDEERHKKAATIS